MSEEVATPASPRHASYNSDRRSAVVKPWGAPSAKSSSCTIRRMPTSRSTAHRKTRCAPASPTLRRTMVMAMKLSGVVMMMAVGPVCGRKLHASSISMSAKSSGITSGKHAQEDTRETLQYVNGDANTLERRASFVEEEEGTDHASNSRSTARAGGDVEELGRLLQLVAKGEAHAEERGATTEIPGKISKSDKTTPKADKTKGDKKAKPGVRKRIARVLNKCTGNMLKIVGAARRGIFLCLETVFPKAPEWMHTLVQKGPVALYTTGWPMSMFKGLDWHKKQPYLDLCAALMYLRGYLLCRAGCTTCRNEYFGTALFRFRCSVLLKSAYGELLLIQNAMR